MTAALIQKAERAAAQRAVGKKARRRRIEIVKISKKHLEIGAQTCGAFGFDHPPVPPLPGAASSPGMEEDSRGAVGGIQSIATAFFPDPQIEPVILEAKRLPVLAEVSSQERRASDLEPEHERLQRLGGGILKTIAKVGQSKRPCWLDQ